MRADAHAIAEVDERHAPTRDWRYATIKAACTIVGVPYFRPRVSFAAPLPSAGFVVACNHVTLLDWAAIAYAVPRPVRFLVTRDYYDRPACRWFCRLGRAIPVDPRGIELSAMRTAVAALRRGEILGIFPEGALSATGRMRPFQRGVVRLAMRTGCAVVPATIRGAFEAFPVHRRVPRPRRVVVAFGTPLAAPSAPTDPAESPTVASAFLERLMTSIAGLAHETTASY